MVASVLASILCVSTLAQDVSLDETKANLSGMVKNYQLPRIAKGSATILSIGSRAPLASMQDRLSAAGSTKTCSVPLLKAEIPTGGAKYMIVEAPRNEQVSAPMPKAEMPAPPCKTAK